MNYIIEDQVGLGTFGKVYRARHAQTGRLYALKRIKMESEREGFPVTAVREAKLLESLSHPNIIRLETIVKDSVKDDGVYFVFPYYQYDLVGLMKRRPLVDAEVRFITYHLLLALDHLHQHHIVHRDVKPSNILISHNGQVCLGDFGLAKHRLSPDHLRQHRQMTNRVVTLWYRAPELLIGATDYGGEVDIWAVGCVLYEMLVVLGVGEDGALFHGNDEYTVLDAIMKRLGPMPNSMQRFPWFNMIKWTESVPKDLFPQVTNTDAKDLLCRLLALDPDQRITAKEALKHPYFTKTPINPFTDLNQDDSQHEYEVKSKP